MVTRRDLWIKQTLTTISTRLCKSIGSWTTTIPCRLQDSAWQRWTTPALRKGEACNDRSMLLLTVAVVGCWCCCCCCLFLGFLFRCLFSSSFFIIFIALVPLHTAYSTPWPTFSFSFSFLLFSFPFLHFFKNIMLFRFDGFEDTLGNGEVEYEEFEAWFLAFEMHVKYYSNQYISRFNSTPCRRRPFFAIYCIILKKKKKV